MEPMAGATGDHRGKEERGKFRAGLKRGSGSLKRKRDDGNDEAAERDVADQLQGGEEEPKKKKKVRGGPKGPNPLAVKKPKKKTEGEGTISASKNSIGKESGTGSSTQVEADGSEPTARRKRRRKHKLEGGETGAVTEFAGGDRGE